MRNGFYNRRMDLIAKHSGIDSDMNADAIHTNPVYWDFKLERHPYGSIYGHGFGYDFGWDPFQPYSSDYYQDYGLNIALPYRCRNTGLSGLAFDVS